MTTATAGARRPRNSATERAAATLPLPNWLAYVIAVVAVAAALTLPFAFAAGGKSMTEALNNYEFNNVAIAAVLGALDLVPESRTRDRVGAGRRRRLRCGGPHHK